MKMTTLSQVIYRFHVNFIKNRKKSWKFYGILKDLEEQNQSLTESIIVEMIPDKLKSEGTSHGMTVGKTLNFKVMFQRDISKWQERQTISI